MAAIHASKILFDGQTLPRECVRYIERQLCPEMGWNTSKALAHLVEVGIAAMTNKDLEPLFNAGILPVAKDAPDNTAQTTRDPDAFFDPDMATAWSFDNTIVNAMINSIVRSKFAYLSSYAVKNQIFPTKDEQFRFLYDASERFGSFIFSYSIATRDSQLSDESIATMKKAITNHRKRMARYVGHLFINCSQVDNPEGVPNFLVDNVIPGDKGGLLVWLRYKDIMHDPVLAQDYITDSINALSIVGKSLLMPQ